MADQTYNQLLIDAPNFMENDSAEFLAALPTLIGNAESRIYRELDIALFDTIATGTIVVGATSIPTPEDLIKPRHLRIVNDLGMQLLQFKMLEYMLVLAPDDSDTGQPIYYGIESPETYRIAPASDLTYPYVLAYRRRLPPLNEQNQTNLLTRNAYDLLLYAVLVESCDFTMADDRKKVWEEKYQTAASGLLAVDMNSNKDSFRDQG